MSARKPGYYWVSYTSWGQNGDPQVAYWDGTVWTFCGDEVEKAEERFEWIEHGTWRGRLPLRYAEYVIQPISKRLRPPSPKPTTGE